MLLDDGTVYPADLVVMATGIRPETRIATDAGLDVERGIVVDDQMRTSDPSIFAVGECVEHAGICYGFVEPLFDMAAVAARTLSGEAAAFRPAQCGTNLKVLGVNVFSAGDFLGAPDTEQIVLSDPGLGTYKKLVIKDGRLVGAVLFGDSADGLWYLELMRTGGSTEPFRQELMFGRALACAAA